MQDIEKEPSQNERDAYRRAVHLSEKANPLPEEAECVYQGPDALGQASLRAAVFATVGWMLGTRLANLGSEVAKATDIQALQRRKFKANNAGAAMALMGGVMGAYGGMKDTRFHRKQVEELQEALKGQHAKVDDLKEELRLQLSGKGRLEGYDPEWEKPAAKDEVKKAQPSAKVSSKEAEIAEPVAARSNEEMPSV